MRARGVVRAAAAAGRLTGAGALTAGAGSGASQRWAPRVSVAAPSRRRVGQAPAAAVGGRLDRERRARPAPGRPASRHAAIAAAQVAQRRVAAVLLRARHGVAPRLEREHQQRGRQHVERDPPVGRPVLARLHERDQRIALQPEPEEGVERLLPVAQRQRIGPATAGVASSRSSAPRPSTPRSASALALPPRAERPAVGPRVLDAQRQEAARDARRPRAGRRRRGAARRTARRR